MTIKQRYIDFFNSLNAINKADNTIVCCSFLSDINKTDITTKGKGLYLNKNAFQSKQDNANEK